SSYPDPRHLPSFPTRRSSDLTAARAQPLGPQARLRPARPPSADARVRGAAAAHRSRADAVDRGALPGPAGGARRDAIQAIRIARDRKSTRLNSSHLVISYAVF